MEAIVSVAIGSGIGAVLRYGVTILANLHGGMDFSYGTILVNLIGSFCIGVLFVFFASHTELSPYVKLFFVTGLLGGFTTFSTYNMELLTMAISGQLFHALLYLCLHVVGGFLCCWLGFAVGQGI